MTAQIISIGNSKGIRIPNNLLKLLEFDSEVELVIDEDKRELLIRPVRKSRQGWDKAFQKMKNFQDDKLLINDSLDFDHDDWKW